jgi:hypothetical protein
MPSSANSCFDTFNGEVIAWHPEENEVGVVTTLREVLQARFQLLRCQRRLNGKVLSVSLEVF